LKVGIIIQARRGASRLPDKVLKKIKDEYILSILIKRLKKCKKVDRVIVATTCRKIDRKLCALAKEHRVSFFCGSEDDVLYRMLGAARKYKLDLIVRICGDSILIDPHKVDAAINQWSFEDLVTTENHPFAYCRGLGFEIVTKLALERLNDSVNDDVTRSHVTLFMYKNPEQFKIKYISDTPRACNTHARLCIDTLEDFELIKLIIESIDKPISDITHEDVINLLIEKPALVNINIHVHQKNITPEAPLEK